MTMSDDAGPEGVLAAAAGMPAPTRAQVLAYDATLVVVRRALALLTERIEQAEQAGDREAAKELLARQAELARARSSLRAGEDAQVSALHVQALQVLG